MPEHPTSTRHSRRRLAIWLGFAAVGITMGVVWAAGFATFNSGANGTNSASPVVTPASPSNATNPLASVVTPGTSWNVDWTGDWGSTAATTFFSIDLSSQPATAHYNIAMLLTNGATMSAAAHKFQTLQLKVVLVQAAGATCASSDYAGGTTQLMSFDTEDAAVYFNNAAINAAGHPYCLGIDAAAPPYDGTGTFLRNDGTQPTVPDAYPSFVATVNRVS